MKVLLSVFLVFLFVGCSENSKDSTKVNITPSIKNIKIVQKTVMNDETDEMPYPVDLVTPIPPLAPLSPFAPIVENAVGY